MQTGTKRFEVIHSIDKDPSQGAVKFTALISYDSDNDYMYACNGPLNLSMQKTQQSSSMHRVVNLASVQNSKLLKEQPWASERWRSDRENDTARATVDP